MNTSNTNKQKTYLCECGRTIKQSSKTFHNMSAKHLSIVTDINEDSLESIPSPLKFLKAVIADNMFDQLNSVSVLTFYNRYIEWCKDNNIRGEKQNSFGVYITSRVVKRRTAAGNVYRLPINPDLNIFMPEVLSGEPSPLKFLDHVVNFNMFDQLDSVSAKILYQRYIEWCDDNDERKETQTIFGIFIKGRIKKVRTATGYIYIMPTFD